MQKLVATSLASLLFAGTLSNPIVAQAESGTPHRSSIWSSSFRKMFHLITTSALILTP